MQKFPIALEIGPKRRVFAQALEWIGWCRSGKDETVALGNLVTTAQRYALVAGAARLAFIPPSSIEDFEVVERVPGTATTDFGAPSVLLASDQEPLEVGDIERLAGLLTASWTTFDDIFICIPPEAHGVKPERGRSPDAMRLHMLEADLMHLSAFGPAFRHPDPARVAEQETSVREQILAQLRAVPCGQTVAPLRRYGFAWMPRFAVRRSAWHALDHAWELQDR
ncbi:MAG TPA: hypothetical protein VGT44_12850 [Ktedonobacteraceae bacterium]|nr:hypothetical protein [Ktedonobacteraceae bacterium]